MFADRPDTAHGRSELALHGGEVLDGADMVELAERELLAPLDRTATGLAVDSARRVSLVTAISPRAVVDVAFVAFETLRLVRRIAALYGGRPGTIGLLRLLGRIATHLAATGAIAAGDALLQQIVGHGLAARLSAKLGEGLLNGLLTARVGIAAIEVCRPMPFVASKRPGLSDFVAALAPTMTAGRKQDRPATLDRSDRDAR
jgi:putative membrane protein